MNSFLDRRYFIVTYDVCTSNFIKVSYIRSIVFSFNKNSQTFLLDNFISRNTPSLRISVGRFKLRKLIYTLYYIHLHINMMLMQCFSKRLYIVTPRVLHPPQMDLLFDLDDARVSLYLYKVLSLRLI